MAAKKKPSKEQDYDDDGFDTEDTESWKADDDSDAPNDNRSAVPPGVQLRDWRDVERFREERALKRLLEEDDLLFDD